MINSFAFLIFFYDKQKSKQRGRRVAEVSLLFTATIGGVFGGLLAMYLIRHKTQKLYFVIIMWTLLFLWLYLSKIVLT